MAKECLLLLFVAFYFLILPSAADEMEDCPKFPCGRYGELHFPFTNTYRLECGLYVKGCENTEEGGFPQVLMGNGKWYDITGIFKGAKENSFSVVDDGLRKLLSPEPDKNCSALEHTDLSPPVSVSTVMPLGNPVISFMMKNVFAFWRCKFAMGPPIVKCKDYFVYNFDYHGIEEHENSCSIIQLPVGSPPDPDNPFIITPEINITVVSYADNAAGTTKKARKKVLILATAASIAGVAVLVILICCYRRKVFSRKIESLTHQTIEAFLKHQLYLSTKRYTYSEIKKVTNSFRDKLGKGGYGTVYKGKLTDGRLAAVKVLSDTKGNGEEFINEVASISRTSHVNIVSLLGFCLQGSKRALVYEFMPNGSLEKFICEESILVADHILDCKTLYDIAVGVARGLEYLHRGCNTRILHFDIKPHNILLDEHFCPKISDFGLAKICSGKQSIVSMLGARGTVGYIAPEVFCRNFGGVSHKSDVYSYGMLVLEMFGGRKIMNAEGDCSNEIYFPDWIYKRLEINEELKMRCIKDKRDEERVRKMTLVSLWCIQADPSTRPTMSKVVEMLEGSLESLQVPPKPVLASPPRSPPINSTQTCDTFLIFLLKECNHLKRMS